MNIKTAAISITLAIFLVSCGSIDAGSEDQNATLPETVEQESIAYTGEVNSWINLQPGTVGDSGPTLFVSLRESLPGNESVISANISAQGETFELFVRQDGVLLSDETNDLLELLTRETPEGRTAFHSGASLTFSTETAEGATTFYSVDAIEIEEVS